MTTDDAVAALYQQAAQVVGGAAGPGSAQHVESAYRTLTTFAQYGDQISLGLFPLALALLIFHENFQAGTGDGRFRVGYVLGRAAAVAALIHPWTYGRLCGLITFAAGGHGGWLSSDALLGSVTKSVDGLKGAWTDFAGDDPGVSDSFSALVNILPLVGIWLVLVCSLLFAYIAGVLLSLSQAVILSILLAVGKTCITVTLVPGVGLGSSWARSVAKVAAWSTVAGIITALMVHAMPDLREMVRNMAYTVMLRTAGQFVVLAICTLRHPRHHGEHLLGRGARRQRRARGAFQGLAGREGHGPPGWHVGWTRRAQRRRSWRAAGARGSGRWNLCPTTAQGVTGPVARGPGSRRATGARAAGLRRRARRGQGARQRFRTSCQARGAALRSTQPEPRRGLSGGLEAGAWGALDGGVTAHGWRQRCVPQGINGQARDVPRLS
jgi:hypothetical protein